MALMDQYHGRSCPNNRSAEEGICKGQSCFQFEEQEI
jgi:hypothetical protein